MPKIRSGFIFLCDFEMNVVFSHNAFHAFMVYQFIQAVVQFLRHFVAVVYMPVFLMSPANFIKHPLIFPVTQTKTTFSSCVITAL